MKNRSVVAAFALALALVVFSLALTALVAAPGDGAASKPTTAPASGPTPPVVITDPSGKPIVPTTGPIHLPTTQSQPTTKKAASLDDCWNLLHTGWYAEATAGFKQFQAQGGTLGAIGLASALKAQGKYTEAVEALKAVDGSKDAAWQIAMSEVLTLLSQYEQALECAKKAHELKPNLAPAVYAHGMALENLGKRDEAIEVYKNIDGVLKSDYRNDARSLVAVGQIMERHTVVTGKKASDQATNILQNYLQDAYQRVDARYWQANVAAGYFLLGNYRPNQAISEFQLAAKINPKIPEVFVGYGAAALGQWQFEACLKCADDALKINPNHAEALLLKAATMMQWRKFDDVEQFVKKVLDVAPNHLEGLAMLAALRVRQGQTDKVQPIIDQVLKINPRCSQLYGTIADWLSSGRQFKEAEGYYEKAIEMAPELAEPRIGLGMMYMQTGNEPKALETLTKGFEINNFREDVANYLDLLKELMDPTKYLVRESDHFIVKLSVDDRVMLDEVSNYMESIYPEIIRDYGFAPPIKTLIEILPSHAKFSVRITGKGWVPTIGASTGPLIALSAPNKDRDGSSGTANWAVVLRHEYTHVVTLTATGNRIPHWFTEACAVFQQPDKRAYRYIQTLVQATRTNTLFSVKDLDWGFIRPKTPNHRQLAYAQSEWMLQYIITKHGYDPTVVNMIKGFRDGLTQKQVLDQVLKTTEEQFDKDFQAWAKEQVRDWRFDPNPPPDAKVAAEEAKNKPTDAKAQATYAVTLFNIGQVKPAAVAAQKALDIDANNTKALGVLAYCQMVEKKYDDAIKTAKRLEEADHTSIHAPRILAQCYMDKKPPQLDQSIAALELFKQRQPLEDYSYRELARVYTLLGDSKDALPNLLEMHKLTMNDAKYARQIADIYRSTGQDKDAMEFYTQVTYINPYEANTYEAMAALYLKAKQYDQAVTAAGKLPMLSPESADAWHKVAAVQYQAAKATKDAVLMKQAKDSAEKAVKIAPEGPAKDLLEKIEQELKA